MLRACVSTGLHAALRAALRARLALLGSFAALVLFVLALGATDAAIAGTLTREDVQRAFPRPLVVGEKDPTLPVWPIMTREALGPVLAGYVFESVDLAPLPGFAGRPINLLIALDAQGRFMDVRVLSHHEPIFREGLGDAALVGFAEQYRGLSVKQPVRIVMDDAEAARATAETKLVHGVARGTVSVRVLDKTLMQAALKVARAKLGIVAGYDPDRVAKLRTDRVEPADWAALTSAGLTTRAVLRNRDIEKAFEGSKVAGQDAELLARPDDTAVTLHAAFLSLPQVGRNLLDDAGWTQIGKIHDKGEHTLLVVAQGRYSFVQRDYVRADIPDRLVLRQSGTVVEIRDVVFDHPIRLPPEMRGADARVFRVVGHAGIDPARPLDFALRVPRIYGTVFREKIAREYPFSLKLPEAWLVMPEPERPAWHAAWAQRTGQLAVLGVGLVLLVVALAAQRRTVRDPRVLRGFRIAFLAFTLGFIGWYAQGQLSIVNLTALIDALRDGRSLDFFLYDPVTMVLWAFVLPTLVIWGRGTFCGWLCPFGALQELAAMIAARLGLRQRRVPLRLDRHLKRLKYVALAAVLGAAAVSTTWGGRAAEVEPFKTAISLGFVRAWPYVAWAVATLLAGLVVFRGYCRYLCPLGAAFAVLGSLRVFAWIPRRAECGKPCQTCRYRCQYQAIAPTGRIDYRECFQCLDCVSIPDSDTQCAPLIVRRRTAARAGATAQTAGRGPGASLGEPLPGGAR